MAIQWRSVEANLQQTCAYGCWWRGVIVAAGGNLIETRKAGGGVKLSNKLLKAALLL